MTNELKLTNPIETQQNHQTNAPTTWAIRPYFIVLIFYQDKFINILIINTNIIISLFFKNCFRVMLYLTLVDFYFRIWKIKIFLLSLPKIYALTYIKTTNLKLE